MNPYIVSGGVVDLGGQRLGLGLGGKQVLGLVQTQAEDLSVQVVVLLSQLLVLLKTGVGGGSDGEKEEGEGEKDKGELCGWKVPE